MKAKFVYENLENMFVPKTKKEIIDNAWYKYVSNKSYVKMWAKNGNEVRIISRIKPDINWFYAFKPYLKEEVFKQSFKKYNEILYGFVLMQNELQGIKNWTPNELEGSKGSKIWKLILFDKKGKNIHKNFDNSFNIDTLNNKELNTLTLKIPKIVE